MIIQGCLWIKDKYMEELVKHDETTTREETSETSHKEKHHEL
jgi:hypothetical protein